MEMNHGGLRESTDFENESINLCFDATFDNKTGSYDEGRDLTDDMLQTYKNTFTFLSPIAQKLHRKISNNSRSKLKMHTQNTILASRKNMIDNIQYIIEHGNIANNERVGQLRDELEKFIQETKVKVQKETYVTPVKKNLSFPAFDSKKSKPIARFKGIAG
jgi:hypothetical protein